MPRHLPQQPVLPFQDALSANERQIIDIVRCRGPISRAQITPHVQLAQQSVHRLVDGLMEAGFLRAGAAQPAGRGQPSPRIELVAEARLSVGVSVNTDSIDLCLTDLSCRIVASERMAVDPADREATLTSLSERVRDLLADHDVPSGRIAGLGLGISGYFVGEGRVNAPEPLRDWSLVDLQPLVQRHFPYPVSVENNATTGAIGESIQGAGRRFRTFAYLSFNYGFGGGLVIDGRPFFGANRNAGEFSAMLSEPDNENRPALRTLIEMLRGEGIAIGSIEELASRFDPAWPGVEEWLARVGPTTDRIINALSAILDPEAVVFGGQIPPALAERLIARVGFFSKGRYGLPLPRPRLVLSELIGAAPALGAALLPMKGRFLL